MKNNSNLQSFCSSLSNVGISESETFSIGHIPILNIFHQSKKFVTGPEVTSKDLELAIASNTIKLRYQPIINIQTNQFASCEVLAYWDHPKLGLISPTKFIRLAEISGLMPSLGYYIIINAFEKLKKWQENNLLHNVKLSINLSPYQFLEKNLCSNIKFLARFFTIDLSKIDFELTESYFPGKYRELAKAMTELCHMGATFSLDDFGTGYSSMSRLIKLPIKTVKIDKSFVQDVDWSQASMKQVSSVIHLSDNLGMSVVAEGIETKEQLNTLVDLGCQYGQGNYLCQPALLNVQ